jgi:hypothetical protein
MFKKLALTSLLVVAGLAGLTYTVDASDHDDGESTIKSRNLNLTDLYVFREDWQTGNITDNGNLIFIMNTNPRSLPRQQYFFNTNARYSFHVSNRTTNANATVTGIENTRFDFFFGPPDGASQQAITLDVVRFQNGQESGRERVSAGKTTPAGPLIGAAPAPAPVNNAVTVAGGNLTVFAGLREDPFFFDVDSFFRTRALLANATSPVDRTILNTNANTAIDFAKGYNVNAVVMRCPISVLQSGAPDNVFDVWETISVPEALGGVQ